jgi:predicted Na+-dependent transporter
MVDAILRLVVILLALFVFAAALGPTLWANLGESIRAFVAFYFLLVGLGLTFSPAAGEGGAFIGGLVASLPLTYFWVLRRK